MSLRAPQLLANLTTRAWLALTPEQRLVFTDALLEVVPPSLVLASTVGHAHAPLPFFLHQPSQLGFHLVFGERFLFGLSDASQERMRRYCNQQDDVPGEEYVFANLRAPLLEELSLMQPAHVCDVPSFLIAETELGSQWWGRLGLPGAPQSPSFEAAMSVVTANGWRLPTEAELELNRVLRARDDRNEWPWLESGRCSDSWHPDYVGAPGDGSCWGAEASVVRSEIYVSLGPPPPLRVRRHPPTRTGPIRPAISLLPPGVSRSPEAVAARAAWPLLTDA